MKKALIYISAVLILCAVLAKNKYKRRPPGISTTKTSLKILHSAVNKFKADTGRLPTELEGLSALVQQPKDVNNWRTGGYIESIELPVDQWRNDYVYQLTPDSEMPFVIKSLGADGKEGGTGKNADLFSTDAH